MKRIVAASTLSLFLCSITFSQDSTAGYVFFAPGAEARSGDGTVHFGGGGELFIKNFGVGAELGYLTPFARFSDGIGVLSPNGIYRFRTTRVSPFVTGGYSLFFRSGFANGFNFGAGLNYWMLAKTAIRLEVRDNVLTGRPDAHLVGFRIGLSFR